MIIEKIVKRNGKYFVMSEDGKKSLGGPFDTKGQASKRLGQIEHFKNESLVWEVRDFKHEIIEVEGSPKTIRLTGTALTVTTSHNKVNYKIANLKENDGSEFNFLVGHRKDYDNPDHNVGEGIYNLVGESLKFNGIVENTPQHPNIVEQAEKGRISVSVQGGYEDIVHEKDGSHSVIGMKIPLLALVNKHVRGVQSATIESAIAERIEMEDEEEEEISEGKMAEEVDKKVEVHIKALEEKDKDIKKLEETLHDKEEDLKKLKKKEEDAKKAKKNKVVESLIKVNKELKKEELVEKSLEVLETMLGYEEQKIKETEVMDGDKSDDGDSEVEGDGKDTKEKSYMKGIVEDKETGDYTLSEASSKKFNDELMEGIYR